MRNVAESLGPDPRDIALARESGPKLAALAARNSPTIKIGRETVALPRRAVKLLAQLLNEMSKGNAVKLVPLQARLTTQEAAEILGVSRPFIVKEIKEKRLAYQKVGTHRRIDFKDLMTYRQKHLAAHDQAMDELVSQAQELNMGY